MVLVSDSSSKSVSCAEPSCARLPGLQRSVSYRCCWALLDSARRPPNVAATQASPSHSNGTRRGGVLKTGVISTSLIKYHDRRDVITNRMRPETTGYSVIPPAPAEVCIL